MSYIRIPPKDPLFAAAKTDNICMPSQREAVVRDAPHTTRMLLSTGQVKFASNMCGAYV